MRVLIRMGIVGDSGREVEGGGIGQDEEDKQVNGK